MPKISVLMPIYNTNLKHLKVAISSILSQTFRDFEFLILNDSPENTRLDKIVESFNDPRIKYIKSSCNLGIAEAHNILLKKAKGEYIALMDHDDISLPQRLEKQYHYMENHKEVGICGTAYKKFGKWNKCKKVYHPIEHKDIEALLLFNCPIHHPSSMIRKSVLDEFNITYDTQFISLNDRKLYWELSRITKLHNIPEVLYEYRIHPTMTSRVRRPEIRKEQLNYRMNLLEAYGIRLDEAELDILNAYILNGRCLIDSNEILKQINVILEKLVSANQCNQFVDEIAFQKVCAKYLIKRCKNAALKGFVSSKKILAMTKLPVNCPWWLNVFNLIAREK